ncbi:MAG: histidinol dehydrogenase, partial [Dehalococcoidia bacterium]
MRIARGADEARNTVLRRADLEAGELPASVRQEIRRVFGDELSVAAVVDRVLNDVWAEGDAAVLRYNQDIDGVHGSLADVALEVNPSEVEEAYERVEAEVVAALRFASGRIEEFHRRQLDHSLRSFREKGLGQEVRPLERVGVYVPGTVAVYPSTALMTAIPAKVAGVREVIMLTPALEDASVSPLKLVAAHIAGVDRVFRAGGVQGIAAMAYGTESIHRVDKVCGPGNVFVTAAKKRVYGLVGIDGLFGPSETVVVADEGADPSLLVADLLAAAEHDELATAILITTSEEAATAALAELESQLDGIERAAVARAALEARGGVAVADSLEEAIELANEFAPEHLCLHVRSPEQLLDRVANAGCVFLGSLAVESIGDYAAGP